ncbi:MAG TPA: sorbosone dehydrogenase family protein [Chitinophagaceae bacterium]
MKTVYILLTCTVLFTACNNETETSQRSADSADAAQHKVVDTVNVELPPPFATKSVRNQSNVIGWKDGKMPVAPQGFTVSVFADKLESPRWIYVAENGDVFVAQADREGKKGNNILLFRDANKDGVPESKSVYLTNLKQPFGMLVLKDKFYVGNTDAVVEYPYDPKATAIAGAGKSIVSLPTGRHWTRNIISNAAGNKIYIAVGSASNIAEDGIEKENRRANILEVNVDGTGERIYASGLRNPVGMDWAPGTNTLWTAVNERDELGDDLVPDYLTSVKDGGFYGWPYSYFGKHEDPRIKDEMKRPDLVSKAIAPEVSLGSHTASLGLVFYKGNKFPQQYQNGAFIGQHGSWNRSNLSGYKVVFVPFSGGKPSGNPQDFLTGFIADAAKSDVYGRPVGVAVMADGSLLVADDAGNTVWRVAYTK